MLLKKKDIKSEPVYSLFCDDFLELKLKIIFHALKQTLISHLEKLFQVSGEGQKLFLCFYLHLGSF